MTIPIQAAAVRTLAARTLRAQFESPAAYVVLFFFYLITGYLFVLPLYLTGQASLRGMAEFVPLLLTFLVPAHTMGLLAEELKSGTFETLATTPLEDWDIVLGKFLGFCALHAVAVGGLLFFPAALAALVAPPAGLDWGETFGILLGFSLLGFLYGAVGLFASSLTKNQIVALVTGFVLCFAFYLTGQLAVFFPGPAGSLASFLGADSHLETLAKGVLDSRDLVYFASATFAFLYLTAQRLRARRL